VRVVIFTFLILLQLSARENPFFPADNIETMPITSNKIDSYAPLKRVAVSFPDYARVLESVTISYKNLDGSIEKKDIKIGRSIDWHIPLFISQSYDSDSNRYEKSSVDRGVDKVDFKFIDFQVSKNTMKIKTSDKLIRNFLMINPHRIVLDFKREANFLSYKRKLKTIPFIKLHIGNHDGYYRVVIYLDGKYRYETSSTAYGYIINVL
jgi:hypothetical protein